MIGSWTIASLVALFVSICLGILVDAQFRQWVRYRLSFSARRNRPRAPVNRDVAALRFKQLQCVQRPLTALHRSASPMKFKFSCPRCGHARARRFCAHCGKQI